MIFIELQFFVSFHISTCHAHFWNDEICLSWKPDKPTLVFSSVECQKSPLRKLHLKCVASIQGYFTTWWFAHIGVERQTNIHTYIHAYKYSHTLLRKQACTHSQPVGTHVVYDKIILIEQSATLWNNYPTDCSIRIYKSSFFNALKKQEIVMHTPPSCSFYLYIVKLVAEHINWGA